MEIIWTDERRIGQELVVGVHAAVLALGESADVFEEVRFDDDVRLLYEDADLVVRRARAHAPDAVKMVSENDAVVASAVERHTACARVAGDSGDVEALDA